MAFTRILVGYDGSFEAQAALRLALEMAAEDSRVQVTAVAAAHVLRAPATIGEVQEELAAQEQQALDYLAAASAYARDCGQHIQTEIVVGKTAAALVRAAAEHQADLLIIGASSRSALWARLTGDAMTAVARTAPCPVLIAHQ